MKEMKDMNIRKKTFRKHDWLCKNPKHTKELLELMKWIAGRSQDTRPLKFHFYIPATNNWNMKFLKNDIYNRIKNQNTETSF